MKTIIPFFPNPFSAEDITKILQNSDELSVEQIGLSNKYQFVSSGEKGLELLLDSFSLKAGARVGVPPLICQGVFRAIKAAGLVPWFFDIGENFQIDFNEECFCKSGIRCLILPHLYGSAHPQTGEIINWCAKKNIFLIHDTAQSFGLKWKNKYLIEQSNGGIYSFGPGKASFSAGGAVVFGLKEKVSFREERNVLLQWSNKKQLISRTHELNSNLNGRELVFFAEAILSRSVRKNCSISQMQKAAIAQYFVNRDTIAEKRSRNWDIFFKKLNPNFFLHLKEHKEAMKFKYVFSVDRGSLDCKKFLRQSHQRGVFLRQVEAQMPEAIVRFMKKEQPLKHYRESFFKLFEVSTEATISQEQTLNAAEIMNKCMQEV